MAQPPLSPSPPSAASSATKRPRPLPFPYNYDSPFAHLATVLHHALDNHTTSDTELKSVHIHVAREPHSTPYITLSDSGPGLQRPHLLARLLPKSTLRLAAHKLGAGVALLTRTKGSSRAVLLPPPLPDRSEETCIDSFHDNLFIAPKDTHNMRNFVADALDNAAAGAPASANLEPNQFMSETVAAHLIQENEENEETVHDDSAGIVGGIVTEVFSQAVGDAPKHANEGTAPGSNVRGVSGTKEEGTVSQGVKENAFVGSQYETEEFDGPASNIPSAKRNSPDRVVYPTLVECDPNSPQSEGLPKILAQTPWLTLSSLRGAFRNISSRTGTCIALFGIPEEGPLDFDSDPRDLLVHPPLGATIAPPVHSTSFRAYLRVLHLKPCSTSLMLRGRPVRARLPREELAAPLDLVFRPWPAAGGGSARLGVSSEPGVALLYSQGRFQHAVSTGARFGAVFDADFLHIGAGGKPHEFYYAVHHRLRAALDTAAQALWHRFSRSPEQLDQFVAENPAPRWSRCDRCADWAPVPMDQGDPDDASVWACSPICVEQLSRAKPRSGRRGRRRGGAVGRPTKRRRTTTPAASMMPVDFEDTTTVDGYMDEVSNDFSPLETAGVFPRDPHGRSTAPFLPDAAASTSTPPSAPPLDLDGPTPELLPHEEVPLASDGFALGNPRPGTLGALTSLGMPLLAELPSMLTTFAASRELQRDELPCFLPTDVGTAVGGPISGITQPPTLPTQTPQAVAIHPLHVQPQHLTTPVQAPQTPLSPRDSYSGISLHSATLLETESAPPGPVDSGAHLSRLIMPSTALGGRAGVGSGVTGCHTSLGESVAITGENASTYAGADTMQSTPQSSRSKANDGIPKLDQVVMVDDDVDVRETRLHQAPNQSGESTNMNANAQALTNKEVTRWLENGAYDMDKNMPEEMVRALSSAFAAGSAMARAAAADALVNTTAGRACSEAQTEDVGEEASQARSIVTSERLYKRKFDELVSQLLPVGKVARGMLEAKEDNDTDDEEMDVPRLSQEIREKYKSKGRRDGENAHASELERVRNTLTKLRGMVRVFAENVVGQCVLRKSDEEVDAWFRDYVDMFVGMPQL